MPAMIAQRTRKLEHRENLEHPETWSTVKTWSALKHGAPSNMEHSESREC